MVSSLKVKKKRWYTHIQQQQIKIWTSIPQ